MSKITPALASLVNALTLIIFGAWGYFASTDGSITALIPVVFGIALLAMNKGVKNENKVIAHIAVVLTVLILFGLLKPLDRLHRAGKCRSHHPGCGNDAYHDSGNCLFCS